MPFNNIKEHDVTCLLHEPCVNGIIYVFQQKSSHVLVITSGLTKISSLYYYGPNWQRFTLVWLQYSMFIDLFQYIFRFIQCKLIPKVTLIGFTYIFH